VPSRPAALTSAGCYDPRACYGMPIITQLARRAVCTRREKRYGTGNRSASAVGQPFGVTGPTPLALGNAVCETGLVRGEFPVWRATARSRAARRHVPRAPPFAAAPRSASHPHSIARGSHLQRGCALAQAGPWISRRMSGGPPEGLSEHGRRYGPGGRRLLLSAFRTAAAAGGTRSSHRVGSPRLNDAECHLPRSRRWGSRKLWRSRMPKGRLSCAKPAASRGLLKNSR